MAPTNGNGVGQALPPSPPLTARQRDHQRGEMVKTLNAVILELNAHTQAIREVREQVAGCQADQAAFAGRSLWQRVRWIVTGR